MGNARIEIAEGVEVIEHEPKVRADDGITPVTDEKGRLICTCGQHIELLQFERHAIQSHREQMRMIQQLNNSRVNAANAVNQEKEQ